MSLHCRVLCGATAVYFSLYLVLVFQQTSVAFFCFIVRFLQGGDKSGKRFFVGQFRIDLLTADRTDVAHMKFLT